MAVPCQITALYPALSSCLDSTRYAQAISGCPTLHLPAGALVFSEHQDCPGFPLLLNGSIKVIKSTPAGREILLYRIKPGGSCIVTSSCLLGETRYTARGIAETELDLLILPPPLFQQLVAELPPFRQFVFNLFAERITELMQLVEEVAFNRLDQRLAKLLLAKNQPVIHATHQQLAEELGSVREIVSRLLKGLETQNMLTLAREQVTLLDQERLANLARGSTE